ncbi:MAG: sel1 repeat family protein [Deltaproteobacteria bacterium]|nr:sel1 repeat family protein [Deltaproteobacteria bacterium]
MTRSFFVGLSSLVLLAAPARAEPCELATPSDCLQRGLELLQTDDPASVGFFVRACESKLPDACAQVGFLYMGSTVLARDDAQALAFSKRGCELGSGLGCNNAAVLTRDGRGAAPDAKVMKGFAERSCKLAHADGCYLLGAIYEEGVGGKKPDLKTANRHFERACELEDARSCETMGARYNYGALGAKKDAKLAAARWGRACDLGHSGACNDLGVGVAEGRAGFPAGGEEKALELFRRGCELAAESQACANRDLAVKALASKAAGAKEGTSELALGSRVGKKVTARLAGGPTPVVGAEGEVTKQVSQLGFTMDLVIGSVRVTAVAGGKVELEVLADQSEIVVDGKKVDHWVAGSALKLNWKAP